MSSTKHPLCFARVKRSKTYKFGKGLPKGTIVVLFGETNDETNETVYMGAINKDDTIRYGLSKLDFDFVDGYLIEFEVPDQPNGQALMYAKNLGELGAKMEKELIYISKATKIRITVIQP